MVSKFSDGFFPCVHGKDTEQKIVLMFFISYWKWQPWAHLRECEVTLGVGQHAAVRYQKGSSAMHLIVLKISASHEFVVNYVKYVHTCTSHTKMVHSWVVSYDMKKNIIFNLKKLLLLHVIFIVNPPILYLFNWFVFILKRMQIFLEKYGSCVCVIWIN